jgi:hypothetical protein
MFPPRGRAHRFWAREGPVRLLLIAVPGDIEADFHEINAAASGTERHRVGNIMPFAWCPTTPEAILDQAKPGAETEWLLPVTPGYRLPRWPRVSAPRETSLWIELHGGGYVARRLGVEIAQVKLSARVLWEHRGFDDERDSRISDVDELEPRSRQARRGLVTRSMLTELRAFLEEICGTRERNAGGERQLVDP